MDTSRRPWLSRALEELGLVSIYHSSRDVKIICLQRFIRLFAYDGTTLVLVSYLQALGISKTNTGLLMTLTLIGDVCKSLGLTLFADGLGRKSVLTLCAGLMVGSGLIFALFQSYWILLLAAMFGIISPSGNEIGPFKTIEESIFAHVTIPSKRADIYAWSNLLGKAGSAFGLITAGWVVHHLLSVSQWEPVAAYRFIYCGYAILGLINAALTLALSSKVEANHHAKPLNDGAPPAYRETAEDVPFLQSSDESDGQEPRGRPKALERVKSLLPQISRESALVAINLCTLFALDAFASGLSPLSWISFFFRTHYNLEIGKLGSVFFVTSMISAVSLIAASSLAKRFGNVKTMVFTHLPSSICLALLPLPNEVHWSLVLLVLRSCTASMDMVPRSAFLAAILLPSERTAIMGLTVAVKAAAQSLGPLVTGVLADHGLLWVSLFSAGCLKAIYDLGLLAVFKNHEREKAERDRIAAIRAQDEDTS